MDKIRIKNLRSLTDTGEVELKPLTVLVGKNSSGKSTFLRFFPLMKQTLETRTNEPILWYSRYVDFGSFKESLNFENQKNPIRFEFQFQLPRSYAERELNLGRYKSRLYKNDMENDREPHFHFTVNIECSEKFLEKVTVGFEDHKIEIEFKSKEKLATLKINGNNCDPGDFLPIYSINSANILPLISFKGEANPFRTDSYFYNNLLKILKELAFSRTSEDTIGQVIGGIPIGSSQRILSSLKEPDTTAQILLGNLKKITIHDKKFEDIKHNLLGMHMNRIINLCNRYLEVYFSSVKYIAPLRASAERYYRVQGLSVDEIDPQGANIPMILQNMNLKDKQNFNSWLQENFGFELSTSLEGGHTSLRIRQGNNSEEINLADTGFGYSQIIPIILVIWQASLPKPIRQRYSTKWMQARENFEKSNFTVVVEQPELHLHPALQAKLIDIFVQLTVMAQKNNLNIKIIIETHSETMLNRIGYLVAKKKFNFNKDLINVLMFNKINTYKSEVESTSYSERGHLLSWPIGFFNPEDM
ncbi:AAA family ATPase [Priestia megaterium]|uniref:AAA family ATPase n=1 Tax=Priestia megaterium TaxID=1404 RepID=UPI0031FBD951